MVSYLFINRRYSFSNASFKLLSKNTRKVTEMLRLMDATTAGQTKLSKKLTTLMMTKLVVLVEMLKRGIPNPKPAKRILLHGILKSHITMPFVNFLGYWVTFCTTPFIFHNFLSLELLFVRIVQVAPSLKEFQKSTKLT